MAHLNDFFLRSLWFIRIVMTASPDDDDEVARGWFRVMLISSAT